MTDEARKPKDIADLFLKFGGDPHAYQEFQPLVEANHGANPWLLATPGVKTLPVEPPRIQPTQAARQQLAAAVQGSPANAKIPRELDAFFTRLAGEPASPAVSAHGLLSHWRRQA